MKRTVMAFVVVAMAATTVQAQVSVNVNVGVPPSRVVVSTPPSVRFEAAPLFVAPSRLGFYVGVDTPYDIVFSSDFFYLYYGNSWHRSGHHNGPWVEVPYRELPPGIRKHRIEEIRSYRDREYRVYRNDRDHYRGRYFRPDHDRREEWVQERRRDMRDDRRRDKEDWKEDRRRDKSEWKNDRRIDKEERKDDRRRDKEDRKEENRDRKQHGRD